MTLSEDSERWEIAKLALGEMASSTEKLAELAASTIECEEKMEQVSPDYKRILSDAAFWPKVLEAAKVSPEIVGRLFLAFYRMTELQGVAKEVATAPMENRKAYSRDLQALKTELKSLYGRIWREQG